MPSVAASFPIVCSVKCHVADRRKLRRFVVYRMKRAVFRLEKVGQESSRYRFSSRPGFEPGAELWNQHDKGQRLSPVSAHFPGGRCSPDWKR